MGTTCKRCSIYHCPVANSTFQDRTFYAQDWVFLWVGRRHSVEKSGQGHSNQRLELAWRRSGAGASAAVWRPFISNRSANGPDGSLEAGERPLNLLQGNGQRQAACSRRGRSRARHRQDAFRPAKPDESDVVGNRRPGKT